MSELIGIVTGGYKVISNDEFIPANRIMHFGSLKDFSVNNQHTFGGYGEINRC